MSSSSSHNDLILFLNDLSMQLNRYFSISILLFGTIGNLLNCLVLSQPILRSNPCAYLFFISSIANTISILSGLPTRILAGWNLDFTITNGLLCKSRAYIMFVSRTIAFWLIALASVDRWYSSCANHRYRQRSSLRNAQRGSIIISICSMILYSQILYCYDANLINAPLRCYGKTVLCRLITDFSYGFLTVISSLSVMAIFGFSTIRNLRKTYSSIILQKKVLMVTIHQQQRRRKVDRYLRQVLFQQMIILTILTLPQVIEKLVTTLTMNTPKSSLQITIDRFIYNFVLLLTYMASGVPFYIYTLTGGSIFRRTFLDLLQSLYTKFRLK